MKSGRRIVTSAAMSATLSVSSNPELAEAIAKVRNGDELTRSESTQYGYFVRCLLYDIQNAYLLYLEGRLDSSYWATRAAVLLAYLRQPEAVAIYERDKTIGSVDSRFVTWLDGELKNRPSEVGDTIK